jgi:hypothetical protein
MVTTEHNFIYRSFSYLGDLTSILLDIYGAATSIVTSKQK